MGLDFSYQVTASLDVNITPVWPTTIYSGTPLSPTAHLLNNISLKLFCWLPSPIFALGTNDQVIPSVEVEIPVLL